MIKKHNSLIDIYRFIFSLVVVSHHAIYLDGRIGINNYINNVPFEGGYTAVEFFFILSGYFITSKAYMIQFDENIGTLTWNEIFKRIKKIYPYFICSYILSLCIRYNYVGGSFVKMVSGSFGELLLILGAGFVFSDYRIIGPIWYFSALLITILLIFPLMVKYKKIFSTLIAPIIVILIYGYFAMESGEIWGSDEQMGLICVGLLRGIAGVSLGNIVYYVSKKIERVRVKGLFIVEVMLLVIVLYLMNKYTNDYHDFIETFFMTFIIFLAFVKDDSYCEAKILNNKVVRFLGEFSAIIFVAHQSLIWIPKKCWPTNWKYEYLMWMISTTIVSVLVYIFMKCILLAYHKLHNSYQI